MRTAFLLFALLSIQALAQTKADTKSFVVADVHVSPFNANPFMHGNSLQGDRSFLLQANMAELIATAYGIDISNVQGGPTWLEREHYDIQAKVPPGTTQADVKLMLRSLLADRFHLVVKNGTAPMPAYVLSAALFARYRSRVEGTFGDKLLSAMRFGFGGHVEIPQ